MSAPADPDFLLAAACCRWPSSPERTSAIRLRAKAAQWPRFARVVARHRIAGLVYAALRDAEVTPPEDVSAALADAAGRIVRHNMVATAETRRVLTLLSAAGQPVLAMKGVVLGALAYGSIAYKHSKDIDLLILPEQADAVIALLEADGYRLALPATRLTPGQRRVLPRYGKDATMVRDVPCRIEIELHWRPFDNPLLLPGVTALSPAQSVPVGGGAALPTLAADHLYAYLVTHGAVDGWSRLKWIADVNAVLAAQRSATVCAWHDGAVAQGARTASAQALLLCHALFALPLDPGFVDMLRAVPNVATLVAGAYRLMAPDDGVTEIGDWKQGQMIALGMQRLLGRGLAYRWQIARSVLYMQSDMYGSILPPALYPLYPLIRVPRWIVSRGASVFREWGGANRDLAQERKS